MNVGIHVNQPIIHTDNLEKVYATPGKAGTQAMRDLPISARAGSAEVLSSAGVRTVRAGYTGCGRTTWV